MSTCLVHWWRHVVTSDPEIPLDKILDRDKSKSGQEAQQKWQDVWDQAHTAFKEQVQPVLVATLKTPGVSAPTN